MFVVNRSEDRRTQTIPIFPIDQWKPLNNIRSQLFMVVYGLLDIDLMRVSLERLIRNHITILGARIKPTGRRLALEYHLPRVFPEDYALFAWSTSQVESGIEAARPVPEEDSRTPIIFAPSIPNLEARWVPDYWPVERRFDKPDTPLLLVHITTYTNATVIATSLPHIVADQMGYGAMIRSWLQMVSGQEPEPFLELSLGDLGGSKLPLAEMYREGGYRLRNRWERIQSALGLLSDLVCNRREERHTIFFSALLIEKLRDKHNEAIKEAYGPRNIRLTNGDIIAGILMKVKDVFLLLILLEDPFTD
ncbi:BCL5p [Purpureocillium lavendulum]|uniref:BCL5p n=1 Tax=Purpureocillium lavendulum TaxID=1247861 RepID=A0AB34FI58_9HYPO|nr:BCL5p [Purpureocillium lavendulum]